MIDHLFAFADEATAQTDPVVGQYYIPPTDEPPTPGGWRGDVCIANVFLWNPADNTTEDGGAFGPIVVRSPYDGDWRLMIALPEFNAELALVPECELITDRDAAAEGKPFLIQTTMTEQELMTLDLEPKFMGSKYPLPGKAWTVRKT